MLKLTTTQDDGFLLTEELKGELTTLLTVKDGFYYKGNEAIHYSLNPDIISEYKLLRQLQTKPFYVKVNGVRTKVRLVKENEKVKLAYYAKTTLSYIKDPSKIWTLSVSGCNRSFDSGYVCVTPAEEKK